MNIVLLGPDEEIVLRTCSRCRSALLLGYFGTGRNGKYLKTCERCRIRRKPSKPLSQPICLDDDILLTQSNSAVFSDLTKNYLPRESWIITHQADLADSLKLIFEKRCLVIKLDWGDSWGLIRKLIDAELYSEKQKEKECLLCYETFEKGYFEDGGCEKYDFPRVRCKQCFNSYCLDCQLRIYRRHNGLIVCPFCRFTSGREINTCCKSCFNDHLHSIQCGVEFDEYDDVPFGYSKGMPFDAEKQCEIR